MKRFFFGVLFLIFVGCGATPPAASIPTATTSALEVRPTVAVSQATTGSVQAPSDDPAANPTAAPTQPENTAANPTQPAVTQQTSNPPVNTGLSVVFQNLAVGSVEGIMPDGMHVVLADPTAPNRVLPWAASPDGKRIAVVVLSGAGSPKTVPFERASLWVVDVDAKRPIKLLDLVTSIENLDSIEAASLTSAIGNPDVQHVQWNAAGDTILVTSAHEGSVDLYAVNAGGNSVKRLTNTPDLEYAAAWSPDGTQVAFSSASTFGTGAGYGDPASWRMKLSDTQPWKITPDGDFGGTEVLGWLDNQQVVVSGNDFGSGQTRYWVADDQATREITSTALSKGVVSNGRLFYINATNRDGGFITVWDGSDAPYQLNVQADDFSVAPNGNAIVACLGSQRMLWHTGEVSQISDGLCSGLAWSDSGRLAVPGNQDINAHGSIVEADGTMNEASIPLRAVLAGWDGNTLYYFAPNAAEAWVLYQDNTVDPAVAIGEPVVGEVFEPMIVK